MESLGEDGSGSLNMPKDLLKAMWDFALKINDLAAEGQVLTINDIIQLENLPKPQTFLSVLLLTV